MNDVEEKDVREENTCFLLQQTLVSAINPINIYIIETVVC